MIQPLTVVEAEYIGYQLAQEFMSYDEPMPPFETRYPGKLESCLYTPFQYAGGKPIYRMLTLKAAVLTYGVIKNHPFLNGNKRMAVMLTLAFFSKNKKWLNVNPHALYQIACDVAKSEPAERDEYIRTLNSFYKINMVTKPF